MKEFANWKEAEGFFAAQEELLGGPELMMSWQNAFRRLSEGGLTGTDRAVRFFAATLEWPILEDTDRFELLLRLKMAQWYCADMRERDPEGEVPPGESFADTVVGLLIDYWQDVGRLDWLQALGYWDPFGGMSKDD